MPKVSHTELLLPFLALEDRVVLPHMVLPIAVESEEGRAALAAARQSERLILLVPKIDGRYAKVGTVARIEESGRLPDGREASVIRGLYRGILTSAASERAGALWITVEPAADPKLDELPGKAMALAKEYRAILENLLDIRGAEGVAQMLRGIEHPGALADMAGYSPDLKLNQLVDVLEERDVVARHPGRGLAQGQDPERGQRGPGEAPARVLSAPAARSHQEGAGRERGRHRRRVPQADRGEAIPRRGPPGGREGVGAPGAHQ